MIGKKEKQSINAIWKVNNSKRKIKSEFDNLKLEEQLSLP